MAIRWCRQGARHRSPGRAPGFRHGVQVLRSAAGGTRAGMQSRRRLRTNRRAFPRDRDGERQIWFLT